MDCLFLPPSLHAELDDDLPVTLAPAQSASEPLPLAAALIRLADAPFALVLPVEQVASVAASLPTQKPRWLVKALPYAVEELLADEVERLHLALGERLADGRHRVLAVERERLAGWLRQLAARGARVAAIHVDADLLPREGCSLWLDADRCLLGGAGEARLAWTPADWPLLRERCPAPVLAWAATPPPALEGIAACRPTSDLHALLAAGRAAAVDLAQGEFACQPPGSALRRWRPLLWAALACMLLLCAWPWGAALLLERGAARYHAGSEQLYRRLFPADRRIVDLRAQFDAHLASGSGGSAAFARLLDAAATGLAADPALSLERLRWSAAQGELQLDVRATDFEALERLRQRLGQQTLRVQMGTASRTADGVSARLELRA